MTQRSFVTRRSFLGALVTIPAAASAVGCIAQTDEEDESSLDAALSGYPTLDLRADCGAKGDGTTNDTAAFQKAAKLIQAAGGGTLVIPAGTYIVGKQTKKTSSTQSGPYYKHQDIFKVTGVAAVAVKGYGATIRVARWLHYGGFDPETGAPIDVTGGTDNAAQVGRVFEIADSNNVAISGVEIDGNLKYLKLGGQWGDKDRQCAATGVWLNRCLAATITDVHTHHHALDGIAVVHRYTTPTVKKPHTLLRVVSEYNGRQALSWIGGWGLYCTDCEFNHTGRAVNQGGGVDSGLPYMAAPGAGLDIEPNAAEPDEISRDGVFTRCEFVDNAGAGMLADVGDGGYSTFDDCTFWGTTTYSIWPRRPGLKFKYSRIYGTAVHLHDGSTPESPTPNATLATSFEDCVFEDRPWTNGTVFRKGYLYDAGNGADKAAFRRCTFKSTKVRAVYMGGDSSETFDTCTFVLGNTALAGGDYQTYFRGSRITSCHFTETSAISAGTKSYFIKVDNVVVGTPVASAPSTRVDGPRVKWNSASGSTGTIAPGTYA